MKQRLVFCYYAALILILSCQAMYTVYRLGGTIGQGEKIKHLQQQQAELEADLQNLQESRSSITSLTELSAATPEGFIAIQQPVIISGAESVASR